MDMRTVGDKMHSHNSNCIYSVANLIGTLSSSLCQLLNKEQLALFQLGIQQPYRRGVIDRIILWNRVVYYFGE